MSRKFWKFSQPCGGRPHCGDKCGVEEANQRVMMLEAEIWVIGSCILSIDSDQRKWFNTLS